MPQPELGKAFCCWEKITWSKIKRYEQLTRRATAAAGVLIAYENRLNHGVETIREAWDGVPRLVWHCRHTAFVALEIGSCMANYVRGVAPFGDSMQSTLAFSYVRRGTKILCVYGSELSKDSSRFLLGRGHRRE